MADWLMENSKYILVSVCVQNAQKRFNVLPFTDKSRYMIEKGTTKCYVIIKLVIRNDMLLRISDHYVVELYSRTLIRSLFLFLIQKLKF